MICNTKSKAAPLAKLMGKQELCLLLYHLVCQGGPGDYCAQPKEPCPSASGHLEAHPSFSQNCSF